MPSFTTVNKIGPDGCICKYDNFKTLEEAEARIAELHQMSGYEDAFIVDNNATAMNGEMCFQTPRHFPVDVVNKTVNFDQKAFDATTRKRHLGTLRQERDLLLQESDRVVLPDRWEAMDTPAKDAWTAYRQALRDLPATAADPANPDWPVPPGAIN